MMVKSGRSVVVCGGMLVGLAACGGGASSPDPVIITPELGTDVTYDAVAGTFAIGDDVITDEGAIIRFADGGTRIFQTDFVDQLDFIVAIAEEAGATAVAFASNPDVLNSENLDGRFFEVPTLGTLPEGSATFRGTYAGMIFAEANDLRPRQDDTFRTVGDVELTATFGERVADTVLTGGVTNRNTVRQNDDGENVFGGLSRNVTDMTFDNIVVGDDGVFQGEVSGGASVPTTTPPEIEVIFETNGGDITGAIGGDGEVIAGTVRFTYETTRIGPDSLFDPALGTGFEVGAFVATPD